MGDKLLQNKVALVTGAGQGIGRVTALTFAAEGAAVLVLDINEEQGRGTVDMITGAGGKAVFAPADVRNEADIQRAVDTAVSRFGRLDCACNNAFVPGQQILSHEITRDDWDAVIGVNLTGTWLAMKYEIQAMLQTGGGAIVNISSVAGIKGQPTQAHYSASKAGQIGLTKCAAAEYGEAGIRVNAIAPALTNTETIQAFLAYKPEIKPLVEAAHALGRIGEPQDIANAVVFLCSDKAAFITGHVLAVDGGALVANKLAHKLK